ncbi:MAG: hypothetical protein OXH99_12420 [Bryobacterales bacterium]|nr:hypothetical protein [Bryobacterales bacterium]
MIYVGTSVALAHLLAEDYRPPDAFWGATLVSGSLIKYEIWSRLNARNLDKSHGDAARGIIGCIALLELTPAVLERALDVFPHSVRTLDALHLASFHFLWRQRLPIELAGYDHRMLTVPEAMGMPRFIS